MSTQPSPATFAFVTGHEFGEATFRAILGLPEYGTKLRCSLLACLDQAKSSVTVGYTDLGPFAAKSGVLSSTFGRSRPKRHRTSFMHPPPTIYDRGMV